MTKQTARYLANLELELYDKKLEASQAWIDRDDAEAQVKYYNASDKWRHALNLLNRARRDYPHLFAPFVSCQVWKA